MPKWRNSWPKRTRGLTPTNLYHDVTRPVFASVAASSISAASIGCLVDSFDREERRLIGISNHCLVGISGEVCCGMPGVDCPAGRCASVNFGWLHYRHASL